MVLFQKICLISWGIYPPYEIPLQGFHELLETPWEILLLPYGVRLLETTYEVRYC